MKQDSAVIRKKYDRIAPYFDALETLMEVLFFHGWRKKLWCKLEGKHVLEVGVGTGKNFLFYPKNTDIRFTAIDFSPQMLKRAEVKRDKKNIRVELAQMDIQNLSYADNSFDTVIASFVFCSVPAPSKGLKELHRVLKPGGQVLLLEHVISSKPILARLMNLMNPFVVWLLGANINRDTVRNVQACGFQHVHVDALGGNLVKLIQARK